jgi:protein TonB
MEKNVSEQQDPERQTNNAPLPPPSAEEDIHLARLLPPPETAWYHGFFHNIKEALNPPKLPPLPVSNAPVEVMNFQCGMYGGNEAKSGVYSMLIHVGVVALLVFLGSLKPVQNAIKEHISIIAPDLKPYMAQQKKLSGGGGGGGNRSPLDASKGKLPKPAPKQFTPPRVDPLENPKLPMTPTIVAPTDIPNILATNMGDPLSHLGIPSNGTGFGGGIGTGQGGGVGPGKGPGVVPGSGGGFGGGAYRIGGGVTAPTVIFKVEPEYSEEARKAKWQGAVMLSLVVDENGLPQQIKVTRSLGLGLDQKAIEAVQKWRFNAGKKDGKSVAVIANIEVNFRLL